MTGFRFVIRVVEYSSLIDSFFQAVIGLFICFKFSSTWLFLLGLCFIGFALYSLNRRMKFLEINNEFIIFYRLLFPLDLLSKRYITKDIVRVEFKNAGRRNSSYTTKIITQAGTDEYMIDLDFETLTFLMQELILKGVNVKQV
jgi:hypothetical protein